MKKRTAGILLPITSLASDYGIGAFSDEAYKFADFLQATGQSYWQILPIGPTGFGNSPYQAFSSYAGNPYLISVEELIGDGLLKKEECGEFEEGYVDYGRLYKTRFKLLRLAYRRFGTDDKCKAFAEKNKEWLDDYALFSAAKDYFGGAEWLRWEESLKTRAEVSRYTDMLSEDIGFYKFLQYKFYSQWNKLKKYVNSLGIKIIGDIPIYVSADSAEVWSRPELFLLDESLCPTALAGCPPDGFSPEGQLWGNPLYRWEAHERENFEWWIGRIKHASDMFDVVRIDHFRGFDEYYSVPFGAKNAKSGEWKKAPGEKLFDTIKEKLGQLELIAEDLGFVTESVKSFLKMCGFPGMKVLQFAFDERDTGAANDYLPHNYEKNCVAYTGTHDNDTLISWFEKLPEKSKQAVRKYLCDYYTPDEKINIPLIGSIMRSNAEVCIVPLQDYMGLSDKARINTPSTLGNNWCWRLKKGDIDDKTKRLVSDMAKMSGRYAL